MNYNYCFSFWLKKVFHNLKFEFSSKSYEIVTVHFGEIFFQNLLMLKTIITHNYTKNSIKYNNKF